jgi:hypothetical protein
MFVAEEGVHHLVALVLADLVALSSPIASSGNVLEDLAAALAAITIGSVCARKMPRNLPCFRLRSVAWLSQA